MIDTHQISPFIRYSKGETESRSTDIAIEADVMLNVNGYSLLGFRCSPENLEDLAAGYLYNESFIQSAQEIESIHICDQRDNIDIWLNHAIQKPETWSRTSGCQGGVTQADQQPIAPLIDPVCFSIEDILVKVNRFHTELAKPDFPQHGVHTSMLLDNNQVIMVSNDIGRHNTLDKIAGACLLQQIHLSEPVLITTGRISSEMVYKTARMKIPLAISLHSISNMAIKTADTLSLTLVGHARRNQIDIFSHPERIITSAPSA